MIINLGFFMEGCSLNKVFLAGLLQYYVHRRQILKSNEGPRAERVNDAINHSITHEESSLFF